MTLIYKFFIISYFIGLELKNQIRHSSWLIEWESREEAMPLEIDPWALMRWIQPIMAFYYNQQMTQGFMRCSPMWMAKWTRNRCSTRPELEDSEPHRTQARVGRTRLKWETRCIMATSWKISDRATPASKMWTISKLSNTMEGSHSTKWTTRTSPTQVTETEQALSA